MNCHRNLSKYLEGVGWVANMSFRWSGRTIRHLKIRHLKVVLVCGSVEPRGDNMDMVETQSCTSHEITSI